MGPLGVSLIEPTSAIFTPPTYDPVLSSGFATEVFDPTLYRLTQLLRTALGAISTTQATMSTYLSQIAANTLLAAQALDGAIRHPLIGDSYFQVSATVDNTVAHPIPCFLEVPIDVNVLGTIPVNVTNSILDVDVGNASLTVTGAVTVSGSVDAHITNSSLSTLPSNTDATPLFITVPSDQSLNVCNVGYRRGPTGSFKPQVLIDDVSAHQSHPTVANLSAGSLLPHYNVESGTAFDDLTAYSQMRMKIYETRGAVVSPRNIGSIPFNATAAGGAMSDAYLVIDAIGSHDQLGAPHLIQSSVLSDRYGVWTPDVDA